MKKNILHFSLFILISIISCNSANNKIKITITNDIVSSGFIGNGVEWDPYDEAVNWGNDLSDKDWSTLFKRVDFMKPGYIRCLINSPFRYYDAATGQYDKKRNINSLKKLLEYCQKNNISVMFGEYNPPKWSMKEDDKWVEMSVNYLNYLVNELGYDCIRYFVIFNEPDGNWASTNGDYELWKKMAYKFTEKMKTYPGLFEKVKLAGPDVVIGYKNKRSLYDAVGWVKQTALDIDSLTGIYDIHAYPGQQEVHNGKFRDELLKYKEQVPKGKKIVLGEAGYKYWRTEDSLLMTEYNRRLEGHPFTKGSDCNMLVYDYFYGLDIPLLCIDVMNTGFSGMAAWMMDDAMHSNGDSGTPKDIKIWGMWNILGEEVFGKPDEENIRPWYYSWSLMCRYFRPGSDILQCNNPDNKNIRIAAARLNGKMTIAVVNITNNDYQLNIHLPHPMPDSKLYIYEEGSQPTDIYGLPVMIKNKLNITLIHSMNIKANSFILLTNMD